MTLYEAILEYENNEADNVLKRASEKNLMVRIGASLIGDKIVTGYSSRLQVLLDVAFNLKDSVLPESDLEELVDRLGDVTIKIFGLKPDKEKFSGAVRDWIKAKVDFYKDLIKQEEKTDNYEEAVRLQFKDAEEYRKALLPVVNAERRLSDKLKEYLPLVSGVFDSSDLAAAEVREIFINNLFPKK